MVVSFILVALNEARTLPASKTHLDRLSVPSGFSIETLLIDGGSADGTAELAARLGFSRIFVLPGASIPLCRNEGLREARGEWIAFLDADCLIQPDWLTRAAPLMLKHRPLVLGWPAEPPTPRTWVQEAWYLHWTNKNPAFEDESGEPVVKREGFRLITTRNMILHREVAEKLGGFDETLATGEDTDFVFRAHMSGIPCWGLPAMRAVHLGEPATLRAFFRQQVWHANRRAYQTIFRKSGMKIGGNAPLFTLIFVALFALMAGGAIATWWHPRAAWLIATLPLFLLSLAARTCARAKRWTMIPALAILYGAYGVARSLDLFGLSPRKVSWKTRR
ncbi:MAG: glycosyltransferase [Kiritimatiellae bacterium]|nr:glycosyltransferase [Kiritimatiellia bacterium]MDW8459540.1 glycosyltransferase [Verrucomicrobiota bacterium]